MFAAVPAASARLPLRSNTGLTIRSASSGMERAQPNLSVKKSWLKFKRNWTIIGGSASWWTSGSPYRQRSPACEFTNFGRLHALKKPGRNPELLRKARMHVPKPDAAGPSNPRNYSQLPVSRQKLASFCPETRKSGQGVGFRRQDVGLFGWGDSFGTRKPAKTGKQTRRNPLGETRRPE
jgi:hypothetical protein